MTNQLELYASRTVKSVQELEEYIAQLTPLTREFDLTDMDVTITFTQRPKA